MITCTGGIFLLTQRIFRLHTRNHPVTDNFNERRYAEQVTRWLRKIAPFFTPSLIPHAAPFWTACATADRPSTKLPAASMSAVPPFPSTFAYCTTPNSLPKFGKDVTASTS